MPLRAGHYALLVLIAGLVFFLNLGVPPLWDRDEPRNAGCAVEMLARGDWVVPVFNGELRSHKPVLLYWLMMSSYALFGVGEFAARFWSALLGIGTVLLTYEIGRCLFDCRVACWAGIVLATTVMFGVAARAATPDSVFIFCGTLALAIFVHGVFREVDASTPVRSKLNVGWLSQAVPSFRRPWQADVQNRVTPDTTQRHPFPQSNLHVVGMYAAMGLGVLAKGPIGFILPMVVIGMYLLITKLPPAETKKTWSSRCFALFRPFAPRHFLRVFWSMRPLTALTAVLAVALPWYAWVTVRTDGAWTRGFFLEHNMGRALQPMEGHSGPAILFYVGAILVGFFPWSILTVATTLRVTAATRQSDAPRQRQAMIFLLCWVGVYVGLFSLAQTKLPSYVTPCYPALAVLVSYFVSRWTLAADVSVAWIRVGLISLLLVGVALSVSLTVAALRFAPGSEWVGLIGIVPILGATLCWRWLGQSQHGRAAFGLAGTAVAFCVALMAVLPVEVGKSQRYVELLQASHAHTGPLVAFGNLEPSWVFYGGRSIQYFAANEVDDLVQYLNQHTDPWVIVTRQRLDQLRQEVGGEFDVISSTPYFLRNRQLVLARPPQQVIAAKLPRTAERK